MVKKAVGSFLLFFAFCANAEQIEIMADNFFADENKLTSDFNGNVIIKKGSYDTLNADFGKIYFDKDKKPLKYLVTGNVKFKFALNGKNYDGSGDELTYEPNSQIYTLKNNAYLHEIDSDKKVFGDTITINQKEGVYQVSSKEKSPVKFIFQIDESKNADN